MVTLNLSSSDLSVSWFSLSFSSFIIGSVPWWRSWNRVPYSLSQHVPGLFRNRLITHTQLCCAFFVTTVKLIFQVMGICLLFICWSKSLSSSSSEEGEPPLLSCQCEICHFPLPLTPHSLPGAALVCHTVSSACLIAYGYVCIYFPLQ